MTNSTTAEFWQILESSEPNFVYLQGELLVNEEEIGSMMREVLTCRVTSAETIRGFFGPTLPTIVSYLIF